MSESADPHALTRDLVKLLQVHLPTAAAAEPITPGDIVQIHPDADRVFGGLCLRVCRVRAAAVEGYLLIPHRGGCTQAWYTFSPPELVRIGTLVHPEAEWGFRPHGEIRGHRYERPPRPIRLPLGDCL